MTEIARILSRCSPWEIRELRAMGMRIRGVVFQSAKEEWFKPERPRERKPVLRTKRAA